MDICYTRNVTYGSSGIGGKDLHMALRAESLETRDQAINIRASRRQRDLIDRAAQAVGKNRSEFILETMSRESENILLDQVYFRLDDEAYAAFTALLDAPPDEPTPELRKMLLTKAPWE
jgi:uncharacterized protein (DUF1778 family)